MLRQMLQQQPGSFHISARVWIWFILCVFIVEGLGVAASIFRFSFLGFYILAFFIAVTSFTFLADGVSLFCELWKKRASLKVFQSKQFRYGILYCLQALALLGGAIACIMGGMVELDAAWGVFVGIFFNPVVAFVSMIHAFITYTYYVSYGNALVISKEIEKNGLV